MVVQLCGMHCQSCLFHYGGRWARGMCASLLTDDRHTFDILCDCHLVTAREAPAWKASEVGVSAAMASRTLRQSIEAAFPKVVAALTGKRQLLVDNRPHGGVDHRHRTAPVQPLMAALCHCTPICRQLAQLSLPLMVCDACRLHPDR